MSKVPNAYLEARAQEIRAAALRVFARKGLELATMQEIATEAGISPGAIYRYFGSKDELVQAVFTLCGEENQRLFEEALASGGSPLAALYDAGRVVWDSFREPGAREHFLVNIEAALAAARNPGGLGAPFREQYDQVRAQIGGMVRRAQASGEIGTDLDAAAVALTLVAAVTGLRLLSVQYDGNVDTEGVYAVLTKLLENSAPGRREG